MDTRTVISLPYPNLATITREGLLEYFKNSYHLYNTLFSSLQGDSTFYLIPDPLRRPLIFYYAHTAVLYVNKLVLSGLWKEEDRVNPHFEVLFATGVDEMSWDDYDQTHFDWPTVDAVTDYRRAVYEKVINTIQTSHFTTPLDWQNPLWTIMLGVEHERIHLETSSVLIRQLPVETVKCPDQWKYAPSNSQGSLVNVPKNEFVRVEATDVEIGKPYNWPSYGWDNEYGRRKVHVPTFYATKFLITNAEFLEFVKQGGYNARENWTEEGWGWRSFRKAEHPTFWVKTQNGAEVEYKYRAIFDVVDMPWDWPVDVNYHEAHAYSKWRGAQYRPITEAEWHVISGHADIVEKENPLDYDVSVDIVHRSDFNQKANTNMAYGSSSPVDMFPPSPLGFYDTYGNVWEWAMDHFDGFPGFRVHRVYEDFSTPCFDGRHNMIMGGSWVSTGDQASIFGRYAFRRHFFQHLGMRLAYSADPESPLPVHIVEGEGSSPHYQPALVARPQA